MLTWAERKKIRTEYYYSHVYQHKLVNCLACNGSGYYDHDGSPLCSSCEGTGKERVSPKDYAYRSRF